MPKNKGYPKARKEARQAAKTSLVSRGMKNPGKKAKRVVPKKKSQSKKK